MGQHRRQKYGSASALISRAFLFIFLFFMGRAGLNLTILFLG